MADLIDDLMDIQKEFRDMGDEMSGVGQEMNEQTASIRGTTITQSAEPVWAPSDYKVIPKPNSGMCVKVKDIDASCDMCMQICPSDAIEIDDDGALNIINDRCRKCGLCVAACPTDAMVSSIHSPRALYDKIIKAAELNNMVYVTCTRALGHIPEAGEIVVPCVGCISAEVWYAILCEYANIGIYLPNGICDACRTVTGEEFYTEQISLGESWSGEVVDLEMRESDMDLTADHQAERRQFMNSSLKSLGMTASSITPMTSRLTRATQAIANSTKRINDLQRALNVIAGTKHTEKKRIVTNTRQLFLMALASHPETAENIVFDMPTVTEDCDLCGQCADACPTKAIDVDEDGVSILSTHCVACALCADICPQGAIVFEELPGEVLVIDDGTAAKKQEEEEKRAEQRERGRKMGNRILNTLENLDTSSDEDADEE